MSLAERQPIEPERYRIIRWVSGFATHPLGREIPLGYDVKEVANLNDVDVQRKSYSAAPR
jgi:hypothetical protein